MGLLFIGMIALVGCKKEDMSKYVTHGENVNTVQKSDFDIQPYQWIDDGQGGWYFNSYSTNNNLKGMVQVYIRSGSTFLALPVVINDAQLSFGFDTYQSVIQIVLNSASGDYYYNRPTVVSSFRVVTIPQSGIKTHPNVDFTNYEEVSKAFGFE